MCSIKPILMILALLGAYVVSAQQLETPPSLLGNTHNQTSNIGFDFAGNTIAKGRSFFNSLGKTTQAQNWDVLTDEVWVNQTLYDRHGRPVFQTLSAPTGPYFQYLGSFILDAGGNTYNFQDFDLGASVDNPSPVTASSPLGDYYSTGNTQNPYQDITQYPFSRMVYSKLNPGKVLKVLGGNKVGGEWKQSYSFTMPAGGALSSPAAFGAGFNPNTKVVKTVMRDVHGVDVVVFKDTDGQVLAAARSGGTCAQTLTGSGSVACANVSFEIGRQGFVDIHLPKGVGSFTINNPVSAESGTLKVYNLVTEQQIHSMYSGTYNPGSGFYRIAVGNPYGYDEYIDDGGMQRVTVSHKVSYYDYSLNEYDEAGRLVSAKQPLNHLESTFDYNSLGQLLWTNNPDEGQAHFLYRRDGQVRFSFSGSGSDIENEAAYTNYDQYGRPIESGVFYFQDAGHNMAYLEGIVDDPDGLNDTFCEEVTKTRYDIPDPQLQGKLAACNINPAGYRQTFVAGNVSKTWTEKPNTTTTWYSYDVLGRLKWMVQEIPGLDCLKTIDYEYDPETGQVTYVYYQRHDPQERFVHHYRYDNAGQLVFVETSSGGAFQPQAQYEYNESGQLVRTVLGDNLQGIDYVYNLNGQLKLINHPSLDPVNDPGGDGPNGIPADVFGMALDYYNGDYARPNTPTPVAQQNIGTNDQYNGNIKSMRFRTQGLASGGQFNTYNYAYNKNNWLRSAGFGSGSISPIAGNKYQVNFTPDPQGDYMVNGITYDPNGNILSLKRNGYTDGNGTNSMDDFTYHYGNNNQLLWVGDAGDNPDQTRYDDLRDQPQNNYVYNARGELVQNVQEGLEYDYYTTGLVREIKRNGVPLVRFFYNDRGQRVRKESFDQNGHPVFKTFYVRDAAGNVMAIYRNGNLREQAIYGNSRLGVHYRTSGSDVYELTDHLGNVRAVVSRQAGTPVAVMAKTDYYPFGMAMPGRHVDGDYRYAFQGQEKDDETGMEAFELRLWDARIGRWLTVDPYGQYFSPYMGMDNNPVSSIDPDGGCTDCSECPDACGQLNMENIPAGQSIDMNLDGYFLRNDLQSSLGEAANLGIIQDGPGISMQLFPTFPAMSEQSGWDHFIDEVNLNLQGYRFEQNMYMVNAQGNVTGLLKVAVANPPFGPGGALKTIKTINGIKLTGFTKHGLMRVIGRGIKPSSILNTIRKPLKYNPAIIDQLGRPSQRFIGRYSEVVLNPQTGKIISANPTSTRKLKKLLKEYNNGN